PPTDHPPNPHRQAPVTNPAPHTTYSPPPSPSPAKTQGTGQEQKDSRRRSRRPSLPEGSPGGEAPRVRSVSGVERGGRRQATLADDDLRRHFPDPDLDDRDWAEIAVPHHWRSHEAFAASDGPIVYRRRFEAPGPDPLTPGRRTWLQFDGLFYQGDAWLDGAYLG